MSRELEADRRLDGAGEVLVVGGGIGGLACAIAIADAGLPVRVLERAAEFKEIGAGIQLAPNATRLLRRWGLLERVLEKGVLPKRLVLRSAVSARELSSLDLGRRFVEHYGAPYVVCHRNDLLQALLEGCQERRLVSLEPSRLVSEVGSEGPSAWARCTDGTSWVGPLLVGADGLHSVVRKAVSADEPVCAGFASYRGAIPLSEATHPSPLDEVVGWIGPDLHFVQYALRAGDLYNQVAVFRSREYEAGLDPWGSPEELDRAFVGTCADVREALRSIRRDARWYMVDREPIASWTSGRVTLAGDAAHPMLQYLAQGACQALEDAAALGDALSAVADGSSTFEEALARYESARVAKAARVQRASRLWGEIWHTRDPLAVLLRDTLLEMREPEDFRFTDWLYGIAAPAGVSAAAPEAQRKEAKTR